MPISYFESCSTDRNPKKKVCVCLSVSAREFLRLPSVFDKALHHLQRQREDDGWVFLSSDGVEGLKVAQLQGWRRLGNHQRGLLQRPGSVHLSLCCDHLERSKEVMNTGTLLCVVTFEWIWMCLYLGSGLAGGLSLGGHGSLELEGQLDVFDLHSLHFDPPVVSGNIKTGLRRQRDEATNLWALKCLQRLLMFL